MLVIAKQLPILAPAVVDSHVIWMKPALVNISDRNDIPRAKFISYFEHGADPF